MKKRYGFHRITINEQSFQYAWSINDTVKLIVYDEKDKRYEITNPSIIQKENPTWFGKHSQKNRTRRGRYTIGMYEANQVIRTLFFNEVNTKYHEQNILY